MKARIKLSVIFIIVMIAVIGASQSVNQNVREKKVKTSIPKPFKPGRLYTEEDVEFLMQANHWSRQTSIDVLEMASDAAVQASKKAKN